MTEQRKQSNFFSMLNRENEVLPLLRHFFMRHLKLRTAGMRHLTQLSLTGGKGFTPSEEPVRTRDKCASMLKILFHSYGCGSAVSVEHLHFSKTLDDLCLAAEGAFGILHDTGTTYET